MFFFKTMGAVGSAGCTGFRLAWQGTRRCFQFLRDFGIVKSIKILSGNSVTGINLYVFVCKWLVGPSSTSSTITSFFT
jgi:hypothetical protein